MHSYDNIPPMLKQSPNWVAWGIRDAPPKAPFNPESLLSGRPSPAKAGVRETWSSYQNAVECIAAGERNASGIVHVAVHARAVLAGHCAEYHGKRQIVPHLYRWGTI